MTIEFLTRKGERTFHASEINTDNYFREVRRALCCQMFGEERITEAQYVAFCRRWEREGGMFNKENSQPKFDAWSLVRGTSRIIFNYGRFFARYPTMRDQVILLRKSLDIVVKDNLK